jgi:hypothetical protein
LPSAPRTDPGVQFSRTGLLSTTRFRSEHFATATPFCLVAWRYLSAQNSPYTIGERLLPHYDSAGCEGPFSMSYMAVISERLESNPDGSSRKAGKKDSAIIIYQPKAQFAQPAIPTEEIAAKSRVFREVDNALQGDAEEFNDDHVAIGLKCPTRSRSERLRLASFDIDAKHLSDFISEDAGFGAGVYIPGGLNLFPSK